MMFDIWHETDKLKNHVMVDEYIAKKLLIIHVVVSSKDLII